MTVQQPITGYLTAEDVQRVKAITGVTVRHIAEHVSSLTGIPAADILGKSRKANIRSARWLVWSIARRHGMTLPQIARASGHDHTTVLHGIQREEALRQAEAQA